jgi:hypothetical protein
MKNKGIYTLILALIHLSILQTAGMGYSLRDSKNCNVSPIRSNVKIEFHSQVKSKDNIVSKTKKYYGEGELGVKISKK